MFFIFGSKENTDLCMGTRVGYQILLALLLRMSLGPSSNWGPELENATKMNGKDFCTLPVLF